MGLKEDLGFIDTEENTMEKFDMDKFLKGLQGNGVEADGKGEEEPANVDNQQTGNE